MDVIRAKLEALGYAPADWQLPVTEEFVAGFERDYGLRLPAEYRAFLLAFGGWNGSATCDFLEQPTPNGTGAWVDLFYGRMAPEREVYDIRWATDSVGGAPAFVAVASGGMNGCMIAVRCGGPDDGHVYHFDRDQRSLWPDDEFRRMFPALDPSIEEWLERRRAGQLPPKPEGYESLYLLARGFNEFIDRLQPTDLDG
ncbi:MAG: SMI1/KNR4 family protein [Gemmataceae bacterium]|nr:SMI1/KNR4 family protein [Gemmataceae bacterium]